MEALLRKMVACVRRDQVSSRVRERSRSRPMPGLDRLEDRRLMSVANTAISGPPPGSYGGMPAEFAASGLPGKGGGFMVRSEAFKGHKLNGPGEVFGHHKGATPVNLSPQAKADFQKLQTDTQSIQAKSQVTPAQEDAVKADLQAIRAASKNAPSQTAVTALQNDVKSLQGGTPSDAQNAQLEADHTAVFQSEGVTDQSLIDKYFADQEAVIQASNITPQDQATLAADQKAIATDLGLPATGGPKTRFDAGGMMVSAGSIKGTATAGSNGRFDTVSLGGPLGSLPGGPLGGHTGGPLGGLSGGLKLGANGHHAY